MKIESSFVNTYPIDIEEQYNYSMHVKQPKYQIYHICNASTGNIINFKYLVHNKNIFMDLVCFSLNFFLLHIDCQNSQFHSIKSNIISMYCSNIEILPQHVKSILESILMKIAGKIHTCEHKLVCTHVVE